MASGSASDSSDQKFQHLDEIGKAQHLAKLKLSQEECTSLMKQILLLPTELRTAVLLLIVDLKLSPRFEVTTTKVVFERREFCQYNVEPMLTEVIPKDRRALKHHIAVYAGLTLSQDLDRQEDLAYILRVHKPDKVLQRAVSKWYTHQQRTMDKRVDCPWGESMRIGHCEGSRMLYNAMEKYIDILEDYQGRFEKLVNKYGPTNGHGSDEEEIEEDESDEDIDDDEDEEFDPDDDYYTMRLVLRSSR